MRELTSGELLYIASAMRWTIILSVVSLVCGMAGGLLLALGRTSEVKALRVGSTAYLKIMQGTPLLMQIVMAFFVPGVFGYDVNPFLAAATALSMNASAFLGDIWRGCIDEVPKGQREAAKALALPYFVTTFLVVIPQAIRLAVPPSVGFLVQLIKGTSLTALVGFVEITRAAQVVNNATFKPFLIFSFVCACYFVVCWPLSLFSKYLEGRMRPPSH
ncbi:amino acid ABC transporter permease [Ensifer sp. ENS11]|uniref:amino acid ABC transporter permease n=1 Tax=Ensifer sp. ENS11 TaxID=2769291 RepID=UPI0017876320|nr:amino acid ABC transporter permease [Ensifer sp. ENS11]MBD9489489.1 amino acid ABC transporter permease [Ensifer sp. ENS11]